MNLLQTSMKNKMQKLVKELNQASDSYYNSGKSLMTDYEYDSKIAELKNLESSLNIVLPDSPTNKVGYRVANSLKKVTHQFPAKSLDKTKDLDELLKPFCAADPFKESLIVVMWKLDGATMQLTYKHGKLVTAATRGNGEVGQDITHNAPAILGIPQDLEEDINITVRGEAVMSYEDFNRLNDGLDEDSKYANPRNLAAASITILDPREVEYRSIHFKAFELVDYVDMVELNFFNRLEWLKDHKFDTVEWCVTPIDGADEVIQGFSDCVNSYKYPVDGLVVAYNNTEISDKAVGTEHHPHQLKGYALKWQDETAKTILRDIEWSPSRTGLLNPVAIFDTVELEGTKVSRASLHNFSILKNLHLHIGDEIEVYKANKIIPQVVRNLSESDMFEFEDCELEITCPSCGFDGSLEISPDGIENIYCPNPRCKSKLIEKLVHFCSRDCMDIEGLSQKTIEKFVELNFLKSFTSIYLLDQYQNEIKSLEGFGSTSWDNLWAAIEASRNTDMVKFLTALGIPGVGKKQAKVLSSHFQGDIDKFLDCVTPTNSQSYNFKQLEGFGEVLDCVLNEWLSTKDLRVGCDNVVQLLNFNTTTTVSSNNESPVSGKVFVITGSLNLFNNRKHLEETIESMGGKVSSSVSKKTDYLINNDLTSTSSKNTKAMELGLPIIDEAQFVDEFLGGVL